MSLVNIIDYFTSFRKTLLSEIECYYAKGNINELPENVITNRSNAIQYKYLPIGIIVASDSKRFETGPMAATLLKEAGFTILEIQNVSNLEINEALHKMLAKTNCSSIICIGGTGISKNDITIEAVKSNIIKEIPGFGELFRFITHEKWKHLKDEIGYLSVGTRAIAGVSSDSKLIYSLPGSPEAVRLAITELIIPDICTLIAQLKKDE